MKFDVAVFDLDGTILDTLIDLKNSVNFALSKNGMPLRSTEEIRTFVGNGIRLLIERAVPENTPLEIMDKCFVDFKEHYKENSSVFTKPYEGIVDVLNKLKNNGIKTAVVSNKADFAVQELVSEYFPNAFLFATGERDGVRRKPCPDSVFEAIKELDGDINKTVYIGDSEVDVETARNSGVSCIAVTWGFRNKEVLESLNPESLIDKPHEITQLIL